MKDEQDKKKMNKDDEREAMFRWVMFVKTMIGAITLMMMKAYLM